MTTPSMPQGGLHARRSLCRLCHAADSATSLRAREMMVGTRVDFEYEQCQRCGSVQIRSIPEDLGAFYPDSYYAFEAPPAGPGARLRLRLSAELVRAVVRAPAPLFALLRRLPLVGRRLTRHSLTPLRGRLTRGQRIADVGGGAGRLLIRLAKVGFRDLTCIDPFVGTSRHEHGVRYLKARLDEVHERFDVVMYHHVLEHVADIDAELRAVQRRLAPDGVALFRLPLLPNVAFDRYGPHWVQLDPPRHLHVPSRSALIEAVRRAGLEVVAQGDDSTPFQFWGSELYQQDIALHDGIPRLTALFTRAQLRAWEQAADEANAHGRGDQGWLLVRQAS